VYKITADGVRVERLAGSGNMLYPNALAFNSRGNLYVSDSLGGAVWRFNPNDVDQAGVIWVQHELLAPSPLDPLGVPIGGANGVAYFPNILYVANTEKGLIAGIPIQADGSPGVPILIAGSTPFGRLITVDGIAVDANGNLHAVMPTYEAASLLVPPVLQPAGGYAPLVQVNPDTGEIIPTVLDNAADPKFDVPLSLAFGPLEENRTTVFITNGALPAAQGVPGPGPRLIQVGIGVPGFFVPEPSSHSLLVLMQWAMTILPRNRK
jgi:sugar lactone lactonase YvrE